MDNKPSNPVNLEKHIESQLRPIGVLGFPFGIEEVPAVGNDEYQLSKHECVVSGDANQAKVNLEYRILTGPQAGWTVAVTGYKKLHKSGDDDVHHAERANDRHYIIACKDQTGAMQDFYYEDSRVQTRGQRHNSEKIVRTKGPEAELRQLLGNSSRASSSNSSRESLPASQYETCLAAVRDNMPNIQTSNDIRSVGNLQQHLVTEAATTADLNTFNAIMSAADAVGTYAYCGDKNPKYAQDAWNSLKALMNNAGDKISHTLSLVVNAVLALIATVLKEQGHSL